MSGAVAVLDIGKTNVKVATFAPGGALLSERSTPNAVLPGPPYPHADVESIWAFCLEALGEANKAHEIREIVPTTHGAAGALIDDLGLLLPVMDYEFAGVEEIEAEYQRLRPPFSESFSPRLQAGLNLGRQIAWAKVRHPENFAAARYYLPYPQYWAWRLCGVAACEVTSLGAHTDLWAPLQGRLSSAAVALGLQDRLRPMRPAYEPLGPIRPEIAAATGLRGDVTVRCGVHDSNASLLPHLASRAAPFTVISTGTWVICMAVGATLAGLDPSDDTLANVDVEGRPIACARFMGGREYAGIAQGSPARPDLASFERILASQAMALPCFAGHGGPFAAQKGEIRGDVAPADLAALATLYLALMSDVSLTRLGATVGDLIVEGSLATNPAYCRLLAALRPDQKVSAAPDAAGAARGAALLARWPPGSYRAPMLSAFEPLQLQGLGAYRAAWTAAVLGR
jgi:sugar (pentulose or hexulose) kinase